MRRYSAAVAALVTLTLAVAGCGATPDTTESGSASVQSPASSTAPVSLDGTWKAEGLEAKIAGNSIEINIVGNDTRSLYWKGTFPQGGGTVKSVADAEALSASMLGSQDAEKVFTVVDDQIDFDLSIAGTTKTIHLKR